MNLNRKTVIFKLHLNSNLSLKFLSDFINFEDIHLYFLYRFTRLVSVSVQLSWTLTNRKRFVFKIIKYRRNVNVKRRPTHIKHCKINRNKAT